MRMENRQILQSKALQPIDWNMQTQGRELIFDSIDNEGRYIYVDSLGNCIAVDNEIDFASLEKVNPDMRQAIFFFGLSLKEIIAVSQRAHPDTFFIIIEPNHFILEAVLANESLKPLVDLKCLFISGDIDRFDSDLKTALYSRLLVLLRKPIFYFSSYYRSNELKLVKKYIVTIGNVLKDKMFRIGNDLQDSLVGLINNMHNLDALTQACDVAWLKNRFTKAPIFVVAAGPSLDKNMHELKRVGNRGIIIAVDTIAEKLVKNGIRPHFIASVERFNVWEYFYQNRPQYYSRSYLLAPPLVQPEVLTLYNGRAVLPLRDIVYEYVWLADILGLSNDYIVWMGASCAHIAAGFAVHLGGGPVVLVGQDLAYGLDGLQTHVGGTVYESKPDISALDEEVVETEGYYGGRVKTQMFWNHLRILYEEFFAKVNTFVINATEGGAMIKNMQQMPLSEVVTRYCLCDVHFDDVMGSAPTTQLNLCLVQKKLIKYCRMVNRKSESSLKHLKKLESAYNALSLDASERVIAKLMKLMYKTDEYFKDVMQDMLLNHNLQGQMVILWQKFHTIPDDGSLRSLKENLNLQIEFCQMYTHTTWLIGQIIREGYLDAKEAEKC